MRDASGALLVCPTRFHALCLRSPGAREIMARACAGMLAAYDFDGFKYDLFNWLPVEPCRSEQHEHDTESSVAGLHRTMEAIDRATHAVKPRHIVEMKQNYGTPHFAGFGTMMRAGDAPYAPETNFLRTMHVQGYTSPALADYQTFTEDDTAVDVGLMVIRMLAAGIPPTAPTWRGWRPTAPPSYATTTPGTRCTPTPSPRPRPARPRPGRDHGGLRHRAHPLRAARGRVRRRRPAARDRAERHPRRGVGAAGRGRSGPRHGHGRAGRDHRRAPHRAVPLVGPGRPAGRHGPALRRPGRGRR
ncbi:hypothetical protein NKH77_31860 [Streptomyces sp. M19]